MKRTVVLMLGLCVGAAACYADELTDPVEILKKVDAAAKAVKVAKYKATVKGTGAFESRAATSEGTVVLSGWGGGGPKKFWVHAKTKRPGSSETTELTAGTDSEDYYLINHATKKAYVDIDPAVIGSSGRPLQALLTLEFVHPTPFSDEIDAKKQELKGSKTIGGEDCYEIHVTYANDQKAIWHFSKKDFLPRARLDLRSSPSGESGGQQKIMTDLEIEPKFENDPFKFKLPEGYTRTDDFAP